MSKKILKVEISEMHTKGTPRAQRAPLLRENRGKNGPSVVIFTVPRNGVQNHQTQILDQTISEICDCINYNVLSYAHSRVLSRHPFQILTRVLVDADGWVCLGSQMPVVPFHAQRFLICFLTRISNPAPFSASFQACSVYSTLWSQCYSKEYLGSLA